MTGTEVIVAALLCPRHGIKLNRGTRRCALGKKRGLSQCVPANTVLWKDRVRHDEPLQNRNVIKALNHTLQSLEARRVVSDSVLAALGQEN